MDSATALGALLGAFMRHGRENVYAAFAALHKGTATPEQQKIVAEWIDACV